MTTPTPLPGMPEPPPKTAPVRLRSDDYQTWIDTVRPKFEEVARTNRRWTSYEIAEEYDLPDPPNPKAHWGRLIGILRDAGLIEHCDWANSKRPGDNESGVKVWRGTSTAMQGRAA